MTTSPAIEALRRTVHGIGGVVQALIVIPDGTIGRGDALREVARLLNALDDVLCADVASDTAAARAAAMPWDEVVDRVRNASFETPAQPFLSPSQQLVLDAIRAKGDTMFTLRDLETPTIAASTRATAMRILMERGYVRRVAHTRYQHTAKTDLNG